jgi:hypothetical protein
MFNLFPKTLFDFLSIGFIGFVIYILVAVFLFFLFREITLWYFRINENTNSLRRIADSLEEISATLAADEVITEEEVVVEDNQENDK